MLQTLIFAVAVAASGFSPTPGPTTCPSPPAASFTGGAPAVVTPCPAARTLPREIARTISGDRGEDLVGRAQAASAGTVGAAEIAQRPLYRPGEVLETIPGVVISQHSGEGKANQYYLRGFNLDHGTDLAASIVGVPINEPTHAHGQGYSDINWLIPELVSYIQYRKGPYYADQGDFATAGSYELFYRDTIPSLISVTGGSGNDARLLVANSFALGRGTLLYAGEIYHNDGYYRRPDNYRRLNGVVRYARSNAKAQFDATAMGYEGRFNSTDQVPLRAVQSGEIDRYGLIDPTDGGITHRYALSARYAQHGPRHETKFEAYTVNYRLNLFSNFTYGLDNATDYYNVTGNPVTCSAVFTTCALPADGPRTAYVPGCPTDGLPAGSAIAPGGRIVPGAFAFPCGDQREQEDNRQTSGVKVEQIFKNARAEQRVGFTLRNDTIAASGLYLTVARNRVDTLVSDKVLQRQYSAYYDAALRFGDRLRIVPGLRADLYDFDVHAALAPNSGYVAAGIVSPKLAVAYRTSARTEAYVDVGDGFHSNDARGTTQTVDPQTRAAIDPAGAAVQRVTPIARAVGEEIGFRYTDAKLASTIALFNLNLASELTFSGDAGTTAAGRPTDRQGIEFTNFYAPVRGVRIDADFATTKAHFIGDPDHIGTHVPGALQAVGAFGVSGETPGAFASLRLRYFGPRPLIEDASAASGPSSLVNAQLGVKARGGYRLALDVFNILGAKTNDIDYYYNSYMRGDARTQVGNPAVDPSIGGAGVADRHFHPAEPPALRITLSRSL